jgi:uncharacterized protein DUF6984
MIDESNFVGEEAVARQVPGLRVTKIDANGSLKLEPRAGTIAARVAVRVPVEGVARDLDGAAIHILIHVVAGRLSELELFRDDSKPVQRQPEAADVSLLDGQSSESQN